MAAMTSGPCFRLARSAIFAAVCVAMTALGHALMSGDSLPGWVMGSAFAVVTSGAWWLTGRERGALVVTGSTVVAQLVLHAAFTTSQAVLGHAPGTDTMAGTGMAHMHHHSVTATAAAGHGTSVGMVLAHALAGLFCGLWLWRGEAAVFRLGRALGAFVFAPLWLAVRMFAATGAPTPPGRRSTALRPERQPRRLLLRHVVSRRGPPGRPVFC
ncbi:hypothetical protein SLUN_21765 [Streptomyces lunaelactis]|uniref:Integral membrane protein n=2 Tax=Streptomyces lunaelactis TaxID=1535768 RepID=A0A2R4T5P0_9ACTN|nr:hypothetical protein SLUN_21765 [Streptomyces lunaelactis]